MGGDESDGRTPPDTFLGQATYVSHTGSKPMNIVWKLENPSLQSICGRYSR